MSRLSQLDCSRWNITQHSFEQNTVIGKKPFTNIIATLDPEVDRRLALVAHYDSKILQGKTFLGATDSALSVALLMDMALALDSKLQEKQVHMHARMHINMGLMEITGRMAYVGVIRMAYAEGLRFFQEVSVPFPKDMYTRTLNNTCVDVHTQTSSLIRK